MENPSESSINKYIWLGKDDWVLKTLIWTLLTRINYRTRAKSCLKQSFQNVKTGWRPSFKSKERVNLEQISRGQRYLGGDWERYQTYLIRNWLLHMTSWKARIYRRRGMTASNLSWVEESRFECSLKGKLYRNSWWCDVLNPVHICET